MHTFNSKAPHGVIYGHPVARFEQNGVYFDGSGRAVDQQRMNQIENSAQIENQAAEEKRLKELAEAMPSLRAKRAPGRPKGAKNKPKQTEA